MSQREPAIGDACRVLGEDPEWYAHYYGRALRSKAMGYVDPWAFHEPALNGIIDDIEYEDGEIMNIYVDCYNGNYKCCDATDFLRYEGHMWVVAA